MCDVSCVHRHGKRDPEVSDFRATIQANIHHDIGTLITTTYEYFQERKGKMSEKTTPTETKWTDDTIRWPEDNDKKIEKDDEEEEERPMDIFKDPDPTENFQFRFEIGDEDEAIEIELDGYKSDSDEIWHSTGLTLWKASEYLCRYLVKHRHDEHLDLSLELTTSNNRRRILELGAGLGLVGILAHRISSAQSQVVLTDGDTEALAYLRENVELNKAADRGGIYCNQLIWGQQTSLDFLKQQKEKQFDIILASDIIYSPVIIQPLWETVKTLLEPKGIFVMAFARRKVPVSIDDVLSAAKEASFTYVECAESDHEKGIFIYTFQRKE
jgi:predicted nicotinamide N-methyase